MLGARPPPPMLMDINNDEQVCINVSPHIWRPWFT